MYATIKHLQAALIRLPRCDALYQLPNDALLNINKGVSVTQEIHDSNPKVAIKGAILFRYFLES
uniref:Uncharacterized protein n=1 Tax=Utricularia reniformis TaxID=192314 RepID=A0A1Y0B1W6_9LAMI|nr:hypothetical protein AEK19_MT1160 [Utricularia reniformis]ART31374.1 hypothetical protein AEK19_MT1160 [Utricularia reniformis]